MLHPAQVDIVNEVFSPTQEELEHAADLLAAYDKATGAEGTGAVMFGDVMIDEASRKMAARVVQRGDAAGMTARPADRRE